MNAKLKSIIMLILVAVVIIVSSNALSSRMLSPENNGVILDVKECYAEENTAEDCQDDIDDAMTLEMNEDEASEVSDELSLEMNYEYTLGIDEDVTLDYDVIKQVIPPLNLARGIACWGDSMMRGAGNSEAVVYANGESLDVSYWTAPSTLEYLTGITTYNFGMDGEVSTQIATRAGGLYIYTDRDIVVNAVTDSYAQLVDKNGDNVNVSDFSGYALENNFYPNTCYIAGYLCEITYLEDWDEVGIRLYMDDEVYTNETVYIPGGTIVTPKAAVDHSGDILILEIGSNGGWDNDYDTLINQYKAIIENNNCVDYIIVGDTDDPGSSLADLNQQRYNEDGSYVGVNETDWEYALRVAFGDHFFNTRVYMLENGLLDCGLTATEDDWMDYEMGYISVQLRTDWTHFNSYGYYTKGLGIYKKGVELGYWE